MGEVDPVRLGDQAEQLPVAVEAPRPTGFGDFQGGLAITTKEHDAGLTGGIFIGELDCRRTVPLDVDHRDEAIRKDSLDGRSSFKILKFGHAQPAGSQFVCKQASKLIIVPCRSGRLGIFISLPKEDTGPKWGWAKGAARSDRVGGNYTATLSLIPSFGACTRSCFVPRYRSVVWTLAWPSKIWICSSSPPAARQSFAAVRRQSWGAIPGTPAAAAYGRRSCQTTFSDSTSPRT